MKRVSHRESVRFRDSIDGIKMSSKSKVLVEGDITNQDNEGHPESRRSPFAVSVNSKAELYVDGDILGDISVNSNAIVRVTGEITGEKNLSRGATVPENAPIDASQIWAKIR